MKKSQLTIILTLILTALSIVSVPANTITFDPTFNGTGYNMNNVVMSPTVAYGGSMALQSDGKIIVAGYTVLNQSPLDFVMTRFNADGTLDTAFGTNGVVITDVGNQQSNPKVLIQPDGKILLCGNGSADGASSEFVLVRYNSNGSLDTSFNSTGYLITGAPGLAFDDFNDMILQSDGKIVIAGRTAQIPGSPSLNYNAIVVRVNTNGSLDTTFNGSGVLIIGDTDAAEEAQTIVAQPDGKILVGGYRLVNSSYQYAVNRINSNGSLDSSFGTNGTFLNRFGTHSVSRITTMGLQSDGKILIGGEGFISRIMPNGGIDIGFGANGLVNNTTTSFGKIKVLGDDRFLVSNGAGVFAARYSKDGERDFNLTFSATIPNNRCGFASIEIQNDGKIVLGGACTSQSDNINRFAAVRLQENATYTKRFLDFDGDGLTNFTLFRPSSGYWTYLTDTSSQPAIVQFGNSSDRLVPADFTGDGRTDIAVFRPSTGEWFVLRTSSGTFFSFPFGTAGDIPFADDFDGDQIADAGVFRPSTNQWFIQKSTGGLIAVGFGAAGDKIVPSDYDGDNKADIAIYRPSNGQWWVMKSSDGGVYAFEFGTANDKPVQGDYTGDGKSDAAFWRPSTGEWFILRSENFSYYSIPFGLSDDLPTPGNYSGDSKFDLAVYRPSTNTWHVQPTGGSYFNFVFGTAGDQPVANSFVP